MAVSKTPQQRTFNKGDAPTDPNAAAQIEALVQQLDTTRRELIDMAAERDEKDGRIAELMKKCDELIRTRDAAREDTGDAALQIKNLEAERDLAKAAGDRMQTEQAKLAAELGEAHIKIRKLTRELADAKSQRDVLRESLDSALAEQNRIRQTRTEGAVKAGPGVKTDDLGTL